MAPIPSIVLGPGFQIRFEAIDPATGAAVGGVKVSSVAIVGPSLHGSIERLAAGGFLLVSGPSEGVGEQ